MSEPNVCVAWDEDLEAEARALAAQLGLPLAGEREAGLLLVVTRERLELREVAVNAAGPVYADFVAGRADYRRKYGGGRGQLLARAVSLKGGAAPTVVDATAGLGRDAFVLASLGARVTLLERSVVVGALLADGLRRAHADAEVAPIAARMTLSIGDAVSHLESLRVRPEVVYLDPMYPHAGKRALQKKEMRLFRQLVGDDDDAPELLAAARRAALRRVVVKRPAGAPFLANAKPDGKLESKNTRFDLYLSRPSEVRR
jgi:16S rRNA (guanine1516-N2)-methyltransferase